MNSSTSFGKILIKLMVVVLLVVVAVLVYWKVTKPPVAPIAETDVVAECQQNDTYFVIGKSLAPNIGTDFVIKRKADLAQVLPCAYKVAEGDFEVKNENAEYFLALEGKFLVLDSGTAPEPRDLVVYDLEKKARVYEALYSKPFEVATGTIVYWAPTTTVPTLQNCPDMDTYETNGLAALIEEHVSFDLTALSQTVMPEQRCVATQ